MVPNSASSYKADTFMLIRCIIFTWLTAVPFIMFVWKFKTVTSSVTTVATQYLMTTFTSNSGNTFEEGAMYWKVHDFLVGVSLSKLHSNVENSAVIHARRTAVKMELQHTTTVWYGGSCANKHDKLTDTFIQVPSNVKIFGLIYGRSILGWYTHHVMKNEEQRLQ